MFTQMESCFYILDLVGKVVISIKTLLKHRLVVFVSIYLLGKQKLENGSWSIVLIKAVEITHE